MATRHPGCGIAFGLAAALCAGVVGQVVAEAVTRQHEAVLVIDYRFFVDRNGQLDEITDITSYCLECHDGSIGSLRQGPVVADGGEVPDPIGLSGLHPVGQPYPEGDPGFAPLGMLASGMYIVDGNVTCVSCHSCEAADRALVVSNQRSSLCITCHRK